jgi:hypothetical protein
MQDLYTLLEVGWGSYEEYQSNFEQYSSKYTPTYGQDQLTLVATARALPTEEQRDEKHKTLRKKMVVVADLCIAKWSDMSSYIRDGFGVESYEDKRLAAGYAHYRGAAQHNWDDVRGLMHDGLEFANANLSELGAGGMPATFVGEYESLKDEFAVLHVGFLQSEENAKVKTDEKVVANNKLYGELVKMFEDGKKIFRDNAAVRDQFTIETVLELIRGSRTGGETPDEPTEPTA